MNARQKCKKLKKKIKELENISIPKYKIQTSQIPVEKYAVAFRIDYEDPMFSALVEQQEELAKHYCAKQIAEFIGGKHFHITNAKEDEKGKTYYIEFWIGQEIEQI